ncbi:MAG: DUF1810 domain-containing protein [Phenylobacterium sp.]
MADPFELKRFVDAQAGVIDRALAELNAGRKASHWMWFVFPQLKGLGRSPTALHYGIGSLDEGRAYLAHPVLGPRLQAAAQAAFAAPAASLHALFGSPDDLKFVSSMTLFEKAEGGQGGIYAQALDRWAGGRRDPQTLALLGEA